MSTKTGLQRALVTLIVIAVVLPIGVCVILALGELLGAMGDSAGGVVLDRVALATGVLWVVDLICLVLALGVNSLIDPRGPPDEPH